MKTLNDYCLSIADGDHQAPPKSESGVPFVTISCLDPNGGAIDFSNASFVPREYYNKLPDNRLAKPGDVLLSVVGSLGIPYLVKEGDEFAFQRHIAILRPGKDILPAFLYYLLKSPVVFHVIDSIAQGAAQRTLTLAQLRGLEVDVPSIAKQKEVVDVLAAYDDLIENNRKQIKLLEEAAQRLYKEWFVDLRFPGHETTPIIDGLPEGWRACKLGDFVEFRRGKTITKAETTEGNIPVVAGGLTPAYYHGSSNAVGPVVTVSGSGANAGFTKLYCRDIWASDCSFVDSSMTDFVLFVYLTAKVLGCDFKNLQRGSAQPHVYPKHINALVALLPDEETLVAFEGKMKIIYKTVEELEKQTALLREARDRLLPKLMSGEIEV